MIDSDSADRPLHNKGNIDFVWGIWKAEIECEEALK